MKQNLQLFSLFVILFSLNACATIANLNSDVTTLKTDVAQLKREVAGLQDLRKELAESSVGIDEVKNNLQDLRGEVDENQHAVDKSLKQIIERMTLLEKTTSGSLPSIPGSTTPLGPSDPEELYADAYQIYKEGRYAEARDAFSKFLRQFPQTEYSDNAQFWIGEGFFKERKYEEAILAYEDVVKKYPQGNKVPDALLKQGICFKALGDKASARIILQRVIEKYPNSSQAETAQKELEGLS